MKPRHDFDNEGENFFPFKYKGENYILKEASGESVAVSRDFRLLSIDYDLQVDESDSVKGSPKNLGKGNESNLLMVWMNVYCCSKEEPDNPDKATQRVDKAFFYSWPDRLHQRLTEELGKMSGLEPEPKDADKAKAEKEREDQLGNSPTP